MISDEQKALGVWLSNRIAKLSSLMILIMIVLVGLIYYAGQQVQVTMDQEARYIKLHDAVLDLSNLTNRLDAQQVSFFLSKDSTEAEIYDRISDQALRAISEIQRIDESERFNSLLQKVSEQIQEHTQTFSLAYLSQMQLGLSLEEGLQKEMRSTAHELEALMKKCVKDARLEVDLLQMRRHEKDLFLKKELRDAIPMSILEENYKNRLNMLRVSSKVKNQLLDLVNEYVDTYDSVAKSLTYIEDKKKDLENIHVQNEVIVFNLLDYSRSYSLDLQERVKQEFNQWKMIIGATAFVFLFIIGLYGLSTLRVLSRLK